MHTHPLLSPSVLLAAHLSTVLLPLFAVIVNIRPLVSPVDRNTVLHLLILVFKVLEIPNEIPDKYRLFWYFLLKSVFSCYRNKIAISLGSKIRWEPIFTFTLWLFKVIVAFLSAFVLQKSTMPRTDCMKLRDDAPSLLFNEFFLQQNPFKSIFFFISSFKPGLDRRDENKIKKIKKSNQSHSKSKTSILTAASVISSYYWNILSGGGNSVYGLNELLRSSPANQHPVMVGLNWKSPHSDHRCPRPLLWTANATRINAPHALRFWAKITLSPQISEIAQLTGAESEAFQVLHLKQSR